MDIIIYIVAGMLLGTIFSRFFEDYSGVTGIIMLIGWPIATPIVFLMLFFGWVASR